MLAQASDWPFLVTNETAAVYSTRRVRAHLARFSALDAEFDDADHPDVVALIEAIERNDPVFPGLDPSDWSSRAPQGGEGRSA